MELHVLPDAGAAARAAAQRIAAEARTAVAARGRFVLALSGGRSPAAMLHALAAERVPWERVHVVQADERFAPDGDPDRNLTQLHESLLGRVELPLEHVHAMPVGDPEPAIAAERYARTLERLAGSPPQLDLVHLGLGADGHTASLVPGDAALDETDRDVAVTGEYQGRRRMTLTYPVLERARLLLWLVTGAEKAPALARLLAGDRSMPAGRVRRDRAVLIADPAAAGGPA